MDTTPGFGLALLAMIAFGAGDLIYKRAAAAGTEARHFIMLQAWFFCPLVTLYALVRQKLVLEPAALWGSLAGLIMSLPSAISREACAAALSAPTHRSFA